MTIGTAEEEGEHRVDVVLGAIDFEYGHASDFVVSHTSGLFRYAYP